MSTIRVPARRRARDRRAESGASRRRGRRSRRRRTGRQPDVLIRDHLNAGALERGYDERVIGVQVVIAEHGELAERGRNGREQRRDPVDVVRLAPSRSRRRAAGRRARAPPGRRRRRSSTRSSVIPPAWKSEANATRRRAAACGAGGSRRARAMTSTCEGALQPERVGQSGGPVRRAEAATRRRTRWTAGLSMAGAGLSSAAVGQRGVGHSIRRAGDDSPAISIGSAGGETVSRDGARAPSPRHRELLTRDDWRRLDSGRSRDADCSSRIERDTAPVTIVVPGRSAP